MNEELNKKIAEWVGLKLAKEPSFDGFYYFAVDGIGYPANFTASLDTCYKYIVPKLQENYEVVLRWSSIEVRDGDRDYLVCPKGWEVTIFGQGGGKLEDIKASAETPALAFCKAVEKLIDA